MPPKRKPDKKGLPYLDEMLRRRITEYLDRPQRVPTEQEQRQINRATDSYRRLYNDLILENAFKELPANDPIRNALAMSDEDYDTAVEELNTRQSHYHNLLKKYVSRPTQEELYGYFWKDDFLYPHRRPPDDDPDMSGGGKMANVSRQPHWYQTGY